MDMVVEAAVSDDQNTIKLTFLARTPANDNLHTVSFEGDDAVMLRLWLERNSATLRRAQMPS
jgi:hypothetical protein